MIFLPALTVSSGAAGKELQNTCLAFPLQPCLWSTETHRKTQREAYMGEACMGGGCMAFTVWVITVPRRRSVCALVVPV